MNADKIRWTILSIIGMILLVFLSVTLKSAMFRVVLPLMIAAIGGYLLYSVLLVLGFGEGSKEDDNTEDFIERDE
jgi:hypothetical protein